MLQIKYNLPQANYLTLEVLYENIQTILFLYKVIGKKKNNLIEK